MVAVFVYIASLSVLQHHFVSVLAGLIRATNTVVMIPVIYETHAPIMNTLGTINMQHHVFCDI